MNFFFCLAHKYQNFLLVDTIILGICSQACPKYPICKICITLQNLKKNMGDEVAFLPSDKRKSFLQVDSIILHNRGMPRVPKITSLLYLSNISKKM